MKNRLLSSISLVLLAFLPNGIKAQSCCDADNDMVLCYLSAADYCASTASFCHEYSLDGDFMIDGLTEKLLSPLNYGPNGTVNCNLILQKLQNITGVQTINDNACDIVFVPVVSLDPATQTSNFNETFIPQNILDAIYDWSTVCASNLVVVTQAEAKTWGYTLANANQNPNTPVSGSSLFSIFDGPFGSLPSFDQGGSFQGVFTGTPSTGVEILANDINGNPTVALDLATGDIVVGDIGIFCSIPAGVVSNGPGVSNNNDILVCNIFSLACQLAEDVETSEQSFEICPGETVTLPDGEVVGAFGTYLDTLQAFNGCDSIITTEVSERIIPVTELVYNGCSGDGYSTIVNGQVYDESNPTGQELFLSAEGCDSLVSIALSFTAPASVNVATVLCPGEALLLSNGSLISDPGIYIDTLTTANGCDSVVNIELSFTVPISASTAFSICPDEPYVLSNGELADLPGEYIDTLVAANGCDSVLFIELSLYRSDTSYFTREICPGETVSVGSAEYGPGDTYTSLEQNIFGCDSLIITQLLDYPAPLARIDTFVRVTQSIISPFSNDIPDEYTISWTPAAVLSCATCPNPVVLSNEGITAFQLSLLDSIGCRWEYPIAIEYVCNVFVPNAFSPNGDGFNDLFMPYTSGCPVQLFQMEIFDRWGGRVFYSEDASTGWDGMLNGKKAEQGVYVYLIRLQEFGQEKMLTGDVVLFR